MKRRSTKSSKRSKGKRRGGNWFQDLGAKIKNEFVNPNSLLRQSGGIVDKVADAAQAVPGLGQAASLARKANQAAKMVGLGKYIKYLKSKKHGKHGKRRCSKK